MARFSRMLLMLDRQTKFQLVLLAVCGLWLVLFSYFYGSRSTIFYWSKQTTSIEEYRSCLLTQLRRSNIWDSLAAAIEICSKETYLDSTLSLIPIRNWDETKFVVLPKTDSSKANLTAVTIGIGTDITAEIQLRSMCSRCNFYGANPMRTVAEILFRQIGEYFETAVSDKDGLIKANVLMSGSYVVAPAVPSIALDNFILQKVQQKVVHFLWIDAEGGEYAMLPLFTHGEILDQRQITVCQMNVELHGPFEHYSMDKHRVQSILKELLSDSAFVPVKASTANPHLRTFFINIESELCLKTFGYSVHPLA